MRFKVLVASFVHRCLEFNGIVRRCVVWLHHVQLSLAAFLPSLSRVNITESSAVFSLDAFFSCVGGLFGI